MCNSSEDDIISMSLKSITWFKDNKNKKKMKSLDHMVSKKKKKLFLDSELKVARLWSISIVIYNFVFLVAYIVGSKVYESSKLEVNPMMILVGILSIVIGVLILYSFKTTNPISIKIALLILHI